MRALREKIAVALGLIVFILSVVEAAADIGIVTIDGAVVPNAFFEGYALSSPSSICPPVSDDRTREKVVMASLLVREGKRQGIEFTRAVTMSLERAAKRLDRIPGNVVTKNQDMLNWDLERQLSDEYRDAIVGEIDESTVLARYRQAINEGDPKLVNVPLLQRTRYDLKDANERDDIRQAIESGISIAELERQGKLGTFNPYQRDDWAPVVFPSYLEPEKAAEYKAGDIIYPEQWTNVIVYIHETKVLSRVRPFQPIVGDDWFARRVARHLVYLQRVHELETSLRKAAVVEEDGVLVEPALEYPECP